jgi:hypothetical protein
MKLFTYEKYTVVVAPEALALKPFRLIWNRDRNLTKLYAMRELAYIYFMCDPRSDYLYIVDENDRHLKIKEQEGMEDAWKPDKIVQDAMAMYKENSQTTSSLLLQDCRLTVEKVRDELKNVDFTKENNGRLVYTTESVLKSLKLAIGLIKELEEVERELKKELIENSRVRGGGDKTVFDDDLAQ